ncbi:MAG: TerB family tellurite resistance protein [Betaproteobacteria bacterium]|nr:TerB family tellurite resistance protein [Pseudomonadota bacterium]NBO11746.1 TerB family tellurite resistance protein [Betaproteobacteria bacterium]NBO45182.1 TerB family tellurite resistance protein [Betaproteobacteria bacterium]NBP10427.1 TerB family tellurite resistance protein [Betaproteobacteria bacterium]NBP60842.1 TerB family tellurite resistance protein [Betaproteobacteria bacterium]
MGLFDMFKSEPPKLSPRMALAVGLLHMMAADGQIEEEEIGQLQSVVGGNRELLETAVKYWRAVNFEQYLQAAPAVLNEDQRLCLLVNACDSLLSDGVAAPQEQTMFGRLLNAMSVTEDQFRPYFQAIAVKNNRSVFGS